MAVAGRALLAAMVVAGTALLPAGAVLAQEVHTITIRGGEVFVNGTAVPASELPQGLELRGKDGEITFSGAIRPVLQIGEAVLTLDGGRLVITGTPGREPFFFRRAELPRRAYVADGETPPTVFVQQQAEDLEALTREMRVIYNRRPGEGENERVEQIILRATEVAEAARALPEMEMQHYFSRIRQQNHNLYDLLVREQVMELEARELAMQLRGISATEERMRHAADLRTRLDDIFDLRQQNRRMEIETLEHQLTTLQQRLQERERLRQEIVERRLKQLIQEGPPSRR
jgi:hypothetical protein